jgi:DNA-directed RNA polymerase subunit RPC12/RpoP
VEEVHEGKKYRCETCGKKYSAKSNLRRHVEAVHEGKKYKCKKCGKEYTNPSDLIRHVEAVHERKKYKCKKCGKEYTLKMHLKRHVEAVHEGKKYKCNKCNALLSDSSSLWRHKRESCLYYNNWRVLRHESLKRFIIETLEQVEMFEGHELDGIEKSLTEEDNRRIDIALRKGYESIFIDLMVSVSKESLNFNVPNKIKRDYHKHCDQLWIIVFSKRLKINDLWEVKRELECPKIKIFHHREVYKDRALLKKIDKILRVGKIDNEYKNNRELQK